jgi:hypothetical protein
VATTVDLDFPVIIEDAASSGLGGKVSRPLTSRPEGSFSLCMGLLICFRQRYRRSMNITRAKIAMKPTPTPTAIPVVILEEEAEFPPAEFKLVFEVLDGLASPSVGIPVMSLELELVRVALVVVRGDDTSFKPRVGSSMSQSIGQPAVPDVELGHAGGEKNGVYRELGVPVGVKVAHRDLRFLNWCRCTADSVCACIRHKAVVVGRL